jgi:hypothetical protein
MTNYRPISQLTVFSKVLDTVRYESLSQGMHTNNIVVPEQFKYTQGSFTENAAIKLSVFKSINQKMHV